MSTKESVRKTPWNILFLGAILLVACGLIGSAVGLLGIATRPQQVSEAVYQPTVDPILAENSSLKTQIAQAQVQATPAPTTVPTNVMCQFPSGNGASAVGNFYTASGRILECLEDGTWKDHGPVAQPQTAPTNVQMLQSSAPSDNNQIAANNAAVTVDEPVFSVSGVPESVDPSIVLRAVGTDGYGNVFTNTIGLGSEMMFAEPGVLLVGPEFSQELINASQGHIERISPITQQMLGTDQFSVNLAEGAFIWATTARMTLELGEVVIQVDGPADHCWSVNLRGQFEGEGDRNTTVNLSGYVAGHAQVMWYPRGAYISEGNFLQVAELALTGARNAGATGCTHMSELMYDSNTGAYAVMHLPGLGQQWEFVSSNWLNQ